MFTSRQIVWESVDGDEKKAILKKKNVPFLLFENVSVALLDVKPLQFERIE